MTLPKLHIRPSTAADYPAIVEVLRLHEPDSQTTPESMARADANRNPEHARLRLVAERDGQIVGSAVASHMNDLFHPQKFWMYLYIHPSHLRQGIGSALYQELLDGLKPHNPILFYTDTSEDWPHGLGFLGKHGFVENSRTWESWINPQDFDPAPYLDAQSKVEGQGFKILTWDELETDPQRNQKYWRLEMALASDMPLPESAEFTEYSYEHFEKNFLQSPTWLPQANLIAVAPDGRYVGLNALWLNEKDPSLLGNGTTGVLPDFKRRGMALALKVKNLIWAKQQGYVGIKTFNRSDNLPMWSINERLGFVRKPAWVNFEKRL